MKRREFLKSLLITIVAPSLPVVFARKHERSSMNIVDFDGLNDDICIYVRSDIPVITHVEQSDDVTFNGGDYERTEIKSGEGKIKITGRYIRLYYTSVEPSESKIDAIVEVGSYPHTMILDDKIQW